MARGDAYYYSNDAPTRAELTINVCPFCDDEVCDDDTACDEAAYYYWQDSQEDAWRDERGG